MVRADGADLELGPDGGIMMDQFRWEEPQADDTAEVAVMGDIPRDAGKSTGPCVLVVDDEPLIRWSLAQTLADLGYFTVEAGDARSALAAATGSTRPIDVVLLDFRLPDSNDLTLLARLRDLIPCSRIIMMTAFGTPEMTQAARDLGAFEVVGKPFEIAELALLVEAATRKPF